MDNYFNSPSKNFKARLFIAHKLIFHCKVRYEYRFCDIIRRNSYYIIWIMIFIYGCVCFICEVINTERLNPNIFIIKKELSLEEFSRRQSCNGLPLY